MPLQVYQSKTLTKLHKDFCDYSLFEKGYARGTIRNYQYSWKTLNSFFALESLFDISEEILMQFFYRGQQEKHWSKNTILHHRKNLMPFFKWCTKKKLINENPLEQIGKPKIESKIPEHFTNEEIEKMMYFVLKHQYSSGFIRKRDYALLSTLLMLGLRREELLSLKLLDITFSEMKLKVRAQTSKSKKDRLLPIPQRLKDILLEYIAERDKLDKSTLYLFTSYNSDSRFTNSGLKRLLKRIQTKTGIYIHTHKFRHTFATKALESGVDIKTLQTLMGHSSIESTVIYLHTTVKHMQKELEKNQINYLI
ncbi:tyrosine-type recombinase/integrase [Candidatus Uabimicrobium sp. HlEnr_7]|uniref:tyrosine-type recombinase/integrase n=1 Tax=Candidatus Uabimicrobium helgolandensis TaxID=3095367 RepID=UPI003557519F